MKKARGYKKMTPVQRLDVGNLIRSHCFEHNGFAVYEAGWDDEAILKKAQETYPATTKSAITNFRLSLIGLLAKTEPSTPEERIDALSKRVDAREHQLAVLTDQIRKLLASSHPVAFAA